MLSVLNVVSPEGVQTRLGIEQACLVKPIAEYFTALGFTVQEVEHSGGLPAHYDADEFYRSLCLYADFQHYKRARRH